MNSFKVALLFLAIPLGALAQTDAEKVTQFVPDKDLKIPGEGQPQGWDRTLSINANFALAQNQNMVGQPEGTSYLFGMGAAGSASYLAGPHEFKALLSLVESFSRTPALNRMVKSNDLTRLEGIYSYYFLQWMGAFARLGFEAPLLKTDDVRASPVDYAITRADGTTETLSSLNSTQLAKGLEPLTMTQSLGVVARPLSSPPATVTFRVGAGARETLASGVLLVDDDSATPAIDLVEATDVLQGGAEVALGLTGKLPEKRLEYGLDLGVLIPFLNNDPEDRSALDLSRIGLSGSATYSMFDWLGAKYQLLVQRDKQLIDGLQVQNNLFLVFKYDLIPSQRVEPAKADPLKEAEAKLKAAEERAQTADERVKQLEAASGTTPPAR
jgi:hypothetical protein